MKKLDFPYWRNDVWATEGYYALCRRELVVLAIGMIVLAIWG